MNNKILFGLCMMLLSSIYCQSQSVKEQLLGGVWNTQKQEVDGLEQDFKTIEGKELEADLSIIFFKEKLNLIEGGIAFNDLPYTITQRDGKSILTFGNRKYFIEKINDIELILLEDEILSSRLFLSKKKI